ncbi:MAG: hypothetical protein JXB14_01180 [Candidatus Altiarchaeota archaeon]|nr:hypothetical protein [Candidatus Altiarchaeota archaeon]
MGKRKKISLKDLGLRVGDIECLENLLVCIPHCDEHKKESVFLSLEGRDEEAEELEQSWKACKKCRALRDGWWQGAWKVQGRLFRLVTG